MPATALDTLGHHGTYHGGQVVQPGYLSPAGVALTDLESLAAQVAALSALSGAVAVDRGLGAQVTAAGVLAPSLGVVRPLSALVPATSEVAAAEPDVAPVVFPPARLAPIAPYWRRAPEPWALETLRQQHNEALYGYGEYCMVWLLWHLEDHLEGLVDRCHRCVLGRGEVGEVYAQPDRANCPVCYGTTFQGGIKARIIRPALWGVSDPDHRQDTRGEIQVEQAWVETTSDFVMRTGDYFGRADASRWRVLQVASVGLRSGFEPDRNEASSGLTYPQVALEDDDMIVYQIPPDDETLSDLLTRPGFGYPVDFTAAEQINGPLVPTSHVRHT